MRITPPQISSALQASMTAATLRWNAASSTITRPCRPRILAGLLDSAAIWEAARRSGCDRPGCSGSTCPAGRRRTGTPPPPAAPSPRAWRSGAQVETKAPGPLSLLSPMYQVLSPPADRLAAAEISVLSSASAKVMPVRRPFCAQLQGRLVSNPGFLMRHEDAVRQRIEIRWRQIARDEIVDRRPAAAPGRRSAACPARRDRSDRSPRRPALRTRRVATTGHHCTRRDRLRRSARRATNGRNRPRSDPTPDRRGRAQQQGHHARRQVAGFVRRPSVPSPALAPLGSAAMVCGIASYRWHPHAQEVMPQPPRCEPRRRRLRA